jgi:hypothetical protein
MSGTMASYVPVGGLMTDKVLPAYAILEFGLFQLLICFYVHRNCTRYIDVLFSHFA